MRKNMITVVPVALAMLLALALPPTASGQHGPPDKACFGAGHGDKGADCQFGHKKKGRGDRGGIAHLLNAADKLELTEDQQDKLRQMAVDSKLAQVDRRADVKKAEIKLKALMRDEATAESEVLREIDRLADLKAELRKAQYSHRQQVKAVLTEEQQEKVKEMRRDKRAEGGDHPFGAGRHGGHGG